MPPNIILSTSSPVFPVYILSPISLSFILILCFYLHPVHPCGFFPQDYFYQYFAYSSFPMHATCSSYLIVLDLITLIFIFFTTVAPTGCEHCPPGYQCNPISGACIKGRMSISSSTLNFLVAKERRNSTKIHNWCVAVLF
jgi:hypothetical protein